MINDGTFQWDLDRATAGDDHESTSSSSASLEPGGGSGLRTSATLAVGLLLVAGAVLMHLRDQRRRRENQERHDRVVATNAAAAFGFGAVTLTVLYLKYFSRGCAQDLDSEAKDPVTEKETTSPSLRAWGGGGRQQQGSAGGSYQSEWRRVGVPFMTRWAGGGGGAGDGGDDVTGGGGAGGSKWLYLCLGICCVVMASLLRRK